MSARQTPSPAWLVLAVSCSLLAHVLGFASLGRSTPLAAAAPRIRNEVDFRVVQPAPLPKAPELDPAPPAKPEPTKLPAPPRSTPPVHASQPQVEAEPPITAPELGGVTLTQQAGNDALAFPQGSGQPSEAPAAIRPALVSPAPAIHQLPRPAAPSWLPLSDLSKKPAPPALGAALRSHYPLDARRRGMAGTALVQARVEANGSVRQVALVNESFAGFGAACEKTLRGSRWSPPLDRQGRAVATKVRYTCRFVVTP